MKIKAMSNLVLKIISIIAAFLFWLVIINITDPTTSMTFHDIPVEVLNENVITSANQVYEIEDGDKVEVTVRGKRSFVERLTEDDFTATADLSQLSKVNAVNIHVKLNKTSKSNVEVDWGNAVMKVKLEKRVTRKFKVEVAHQGELSENYVLGEMVARPNIVEVSCGESKFKKIDHVGVMVMLNGESGDFESEYSPILYDEDGDALDGTNVTFSNNRIQVSTKVLATKLVPIHVDTTGAPAEGYRLIQTDYKPESIRVSGSNEALEEDISIRIPIDVSGAKKDVEREIVLSEYLPANLTVVDDIETVSVRCEIERNGRRTFTLTATDIAVKNLPTNCTMEFEDANTRHSVTLLGEEENLAEMSLSDLGAYVDLSGLGAGTHLLDVQFGLPVSVKLKNKIRVKVVLKSQDSGENSTEEPAETPATTVMPFSENQG
ncbi:MAG: hypothetical protein J1F22_05815 [Lachnospiraceae bacterium]|nr:hypothetical protein [Lachnospiraceae bacterium]